MIRIILALALGVAVAIGLITIGEELIVRVFGFTMLRIDDRPAFAAYITAIPFAAKLCVVIGWFIGAFGGAWLALRIGRRRWVGWVIAAVILAGGIDDILALPHPLWMTVGAILAPVAGGWLAQRQHVKRHPREPLLG